MSHCAQRGKAGERRSGSQDTGLSRARSEERGLRRRLYVYDGMPRPFALPDTGPGRRALRTAGAVADRKSVV